MSAKPRKPSRRVELRTGAPYANVIANQRLFAAAVGDYFGVSPDDCLPTTGATGAIEAVRNHVFRTRLKARPTALGPVESSFALLRGGEKCGAFELVAPERMAETAYVLVRAGAQELRGVLDRHGISVMWGSEFGLTDEYVRLETLEPRNVEIFVEAAGSLSREKAVGPFSKAGATEGGRGHVD